MALTSAERAQNVFTLLHTQWQWAQMANTLAAGQYPQYALNEQFEFALESTAAYTDGLRIWVTNLDISVDLGTTANAAVLLNRGGVETLLGKIEVKLGNGIYKVRAAALPFLKQSMSRRGDGSRFPGNFQQGATPAYSHYLSGSTNGTTTSLAFQTSAGDNIYDFYVDIPLAMLEKVGDSDGIAPTLSQAAMSVAFTTPNNLAGSDALRFPFTTQNGATVTLGTTTTSAVSCWMHIAKLRSVFSTAGLPPFVIGPGFRFEEITHTFQESTGFHTFQGKSGFKTLVKSFVIINNPGELAGEFSNAPQNLQTLTLKYDKTDTVFEQDKATNPKGSNVALRNVMVDQRNVIGDQAPGLYVLDWSRGTNADYPNSQGYLDLETFSNAGVETEYAVTPATNAQVVMFNVYLDESLYVAQ